MISNWEDIRLKTTPNARRVSGTLKKIEVSEGYCGIFVHPGKSYDPKYTSYPYWRLYVEVSPTAVNIENDKAYVVITPKYSVLKTLLRDILVHEFRTDITRHRKSDFKIKQPWLRNLIWDELLGEAKSQMEINAYNVPKIYDSCSIMR